MIGRVSDSSKAIGSFSHTHALKRQKPGADPVAQDSLETGQTFLPEPQKFQLKGVDRPVGGHLLSDANHLKYPSTHYEIRAFAKDGEGDIRVLDVRDMVSKLEPFQQAMTWNAPGSDIGEVFEKNAQQRAARAASEQPEPLRRVLPKDHGLHVRQMEISVESPHDPSGRYFEQLTEIGSVEGFRMVGFAGTGQAEALNQGYVADGLRNYTLHESGRVCAWLEDYGEPTVGGGRLNPPDMSDYSYGLIADAQRKGREERLGPLGLSSDFPRQGGVDKGQYQKVSVGQGMLQSGQSKTTIGYVEYGNVASGLRQDGTPYVLIGKDSVEITRRMLEEDRGRDVTTEEAMLVLASDHGVKPEQVFGIEQPGEFHVDMRMMPVGPGEFALQDSRKAAELNCQWLDDELAAVGGGSDAQKARVEEQKTKLREWGEKMTAYEDLTAKDLEAAGMKVHRVAGAFPSLRHEDRDAANFFNARHGTNDQGERYSILMGSTPKAEEYFARVLFQEIKAPIDRIYFLDSAETQETLELQGGLKCRTKVLGDLVKNEPTPGAGPKGEKAPQPLEFQLSLWRDI
ncbi:hypothetical protein JST97_18340 [bacterium]|nr:hypothetical protein [bacterium]